MLRQTKNVCPRPQKPLLDDRRRLESRSTAKETGINDPVKRRRRAKYPPHK